MLREKRYGIAAMSLLVAMAMLLLSAGPISAQYQLKKPGGSTPASITVTYPNGGETIEKGSRIKITWESTGLRGSMKIVLIDASGGTTDITKRASNRGTYSWTVSSRLDDGKYKIAVISDDGKVRDESDKQFTIQKKTYGAKKTTGVSPSTPAPSTPTAGLKPATEPKTVTGTAPAGLKPVGGVQGTVGQSDEGDEGGASGFTPAGTARPGVAGSTPSVGGTTPSVGGTTPSVAGSSTTVTNELVDRGTITTVQPSASVMREIEAAVSVGVIAQPEVNVHGIGNSPHVWFNSPSAGDEWAPGSQQTIAWESDHIDGNVQISLLKGEERFVILPNASSSGSYTYTVPGNVGLGHDKYRIEAVVASQNVNDLSGLFSIFEPQPIDLSVAVVNFETRKKNRDAWIFYEKKERWMQFDLTVINNGTAGPIVAPLLWRMIKLPENVVVLQEEGAFGSVYPGAWYITASPLKYKISEYERKYVVSDHNVNFDRGNYRLEVYVDYNNNLNEHPDLRGDNVFTKEIYIQGGY